MTPWDVLGWMLVGVVASIIAVITVIAISIIVAFIKKVLTPWAKQTILHYRTYKIPPKQGQVWSVRGRTFRIDHISDTCISMRCSNTGWGDKPEDWKNRVSHRSAYLVREATPNNP